MTSWFTRAVLVAAAVFACAALTAGPGMAHAALESSNPADGAQIDAAPDNVTLVFNQDIQPNFAALTVVGSDGAQWGRSEPVVDGRLLSVDLDGLGAAGQYTVAFRVVSSDGHPIAGTYTFDLTQASATPAAGTALSATTAANTSQAQRAVESGGFPVWILLVIGVVVVGGAVTFMLASKPNTRK
ncbi:copper resistance protein CopC [Rhodococcus oxybenzonivorans]|uniref:copper resistance CopC family protein n=1 Tax=Rhodococcus TaxID=1827 RepID=UPI0013204670|nr:MULTISPECIES: copper resistance CopC family protein [Rhodococcus]MDV7355131.1 copper resistance protein CopC [Rhodococcus oxybenzonivorans]QHE69068.1 Copper resistance protein CopC [Rhodococcus sp. WAY2]